MTFTLVKENAAQICIDSHAADYKGLKHVAKILAGDILTVTGKEPEIVEQIQNVPQIVAATKGTSDILAKWEEEKKIDLSVLEGKREVFMVQLIEEDGAEKLVIVGTETIATLYGLYYISENIGVSPWVYWADVVPAPKKEIVFDKSICTVSKEPSVRYRGFFMNDEWPSLGNFVMHTFGDFNEFFYEKVFDLLLRLKGNYFWPAMWSASLPLDGSEDPLAILKLGTELGITIGQSHHEPLTRASEEWDKVKTDMNNIGYGKDWNYYTNKEGLYRYWEDGMKRDKDFKHMITIGMRGERDTMMLGENSTIQENVELLCEIITDQNKIIKETGCENMPKMLALYKEVEGFYYGGNGVKGLRSWDGLDDTILLLSDDNFGNVRTLPTKDLKDRKPGWGLYYHFDYHGSPISYEWVNSTPLPKVWEQVTMAYEYGIRDLWIVNVGDIRPDELPLSYFMALAYDFESMGTGHANETDLFLASWVEQQFGAHIKDEETKKEIADVLREYTRIHGMRRPEAMNPKVYHRSHFNETKRMIERCTKLMQQTENLQIKIPEASKDAFYGLVYYPAVAGMNLQLMSLHAALANWYAEYELSVANTYDALVKEEIERDQKLTDYYNKEMTGGKWDGMMLSPHACFVTWNDEGWHYPETKTICINTMSRMMIHAENDEMFVSGGTICLPEFTEIGGETCEIELANAGAVAYDFKVQAEPGICVSQTEGTVSNDIVTLQVTIAKKEHKSFERTITITAGNQKVNVKVRFKAAVNVPEGTFIERDGMVSIEVAHYTEKAAFEGYDFKELEGYGKTLSSMKIYPCDRNFDEIGKAPCLTYRVYVEEAGVYMLKTITAPTNNLEDGRTMRYAAQIGNGEIKVGDTIPKENYNIGGGPWERKSWSMGVLNNSHYGITGHDLEAGYNEIHIYGVEAGLALQKLVLYRGGLEESYLGPQESPRA